MSLKVLRKGDNGRVSYLLAAIGYLQQVNEFGRNIKVHGLNLSLGYPFLPRWFAAGQSPLCVEVDRLARSGVVVVVAAGNGRLRPGHDGGRQVGIRGARGNDRRSRQCAMRHHGRGPPIATCRTRMASRSSPARDRPPTAA